MTFWEAVYDLRLKEKISRQWRAGDLIPHLRDRFEESYIRTEPANKSISEDGEMKGYHVKGDGKNAEAYRLGNGLYELIDDLSRGTMEQTIRQELATDTLTDLRPPKPIGWRVADAIRAFTCRHYIEPARRRGVTRVDIRMGDVHRDMGLKNRLPAVCSAIQAEKFRTDCRVSLIGQQGPLQGSNRILTFDVLP